MHQKEDFSAQLNSDLNDREPIEDLQAAADVGTYGRCIVKCSANTLNTPYKVGLTGAESGTAIISTSSVDFATILYLPNGTDKAFIRSKASGAWGEWEAILTKADYSGYKALWSGNVSIGQEIMVDHIKDYNTYILVSSAYPMALHGMRWGSKIMASGIDCNASNGFRLASIMLTIKEDNKVTVTKSQVAMMQFGSDNGPAEDFRFTDIYGVT